jgi:hypothetical protein
MSNQQTNVVAFPAPPLTAELKRIAMGRSRAAALPVLIDRVRDLRHQAVPVLRNVMIGGRRGNMQSGEVRIGNVVVEFDDMGDGFRPGTYFCIFSTSGGRRWMTGYLYEDKTYHIMSWKRGDWQAELFR